MRNNQKKAKQPAVGADGEQPKKKSLFEFADIPGETIKRAICHYFPDDLKAMENLAFKTMNDFIDKNEDIPLDIRNKYCALLSHYQFLHSLRKAAQGTPLPDDVEC